METIRSVLQDLTAADIRAWAGEKIFARGKGYIMSVDHLSHSPSGVLAAWVSGSQEYATAVRVHADQAFEHACTCPYEWGVCKHAVAVLLAAMERVKQGQAIELLDKEDDLYLELFDDPDSDWDDADEAAVDDDHGQGHAAAKGRLECCLENKTREELLALLIDAAGRHPDIARRLRETEQLKAGKADKIIQNLRREIRRITAEEAWSDHWGGGRSIPDYSHVRDQFKSLLNAGQADALLELGDELFVRGQNQVELSDDEGETGMQIAACLDIVFLALPQSSLTPPQQILWIIERGMKDDYSILDGCVAILENRSYTAEHWREVARTLENRLESLPKPKGGNWSESCQYGHVIDWLIRAYERGGEKDKIIPLLERVADASHKYAELVDALLAAGEPERARKWCLHGFMRTRDAYPGIAHALQKRLMEMAEDRQRLDLVAAYRAQNFFAGPSLDTYMKLKGAAQRMGTWPVVRSCVLACLETGRRPDPEGGGKPRADWPLPAPEVRFPQEIKQWNVERFPRYALLIEIAIREERLDDAVTLYQAYQKTRPFTYERTEVAKDVATAVAASHPQVSLDIWRGIVNGLIARVKPSAYEEVAIYLELMRDVYRDTQRLAEWQELIRRLRVEHKPKRRLQQVLDRLEKKNPRG